MFRHLIRKHGVRLLEISYEGGSHPLLSHITSYQMRSNTDIKAISQISPKYNGLNAVFQRMRKIQEIATSLPRLAMTTKWDSNGYDPMI